MTLNLPLNKGGILKYSTEFVSYLSESVYAGVSGNPGSSSPAGPIKRYFLPDDADYAQLRIKPVWLLSSPERV